VHWKEGKINTHKKASEYPNHPNTMKSSPQKDWTSQASPTKDTKDCPQGENVMEVSHHIISVM
jgi:hypothetical protein